MSLPFDLPADVNGLITGLRGPTFAEQLQKAQADAREKNRIDIDVDKVVQRMADETAKALTAFAKRHMTETKCKARVEVPTSFLLSLSHMWAMRKQDAVQKLVDLFMVQLRTVCDGVTITRHPYLSNVEGETVTLKKLVLFYPSDFGTDEAITCLSFSW
jgi:hypothetical protein